MMDIFLDSGAFSAWTRSVPIDINGYIQFIKENEKYLYTYANLDVIGNQKGKPNKLTAQKTLKNQKIIEKTGLNPLPCFHYGEPFSQLKYYVDNYCYIALGVARLSGNILIPWLDECFNNHIPKSVNVHGFAITSIKLILKYPWYSVDSSSWRLRGGGYGLLDLPSNARMKTKEDCYITSIPIGKGIKKYKNNSNEGLFELERIPQSEMIFNKYPSNYKKTILNLLNKYKFNFEELKNDHFKRSIWNAIYLLTTVKRFSDAKIYLAAGDLKSIKKLRRKIKGLNLDIKLNILVSYANKSIVKNIIELKTKYENK